MEDEREVSSGGGGSVREVRVARVVMLRKMGGAEG